MGSLKENIAKYRQTFLGQDAKTPKEKRLEAERKAAEMQRLLSAQREQAKKELVSEHQLYAHSVQRLRYQDYTSLHPDEVKEPAGRGDQSQGGAKAFTPTLTQHILSLLPFSFQGTRMLLVLFDGPAPSVKVFLAEGGIFDADFSFENNVLDEFRALDKCLREPPKQSKKSLEPRMKKNMTQPEINHHKRKILRERGEYKPELPAYTPVQRSDAYKLLAPSSKAATRSKPFNPPSFESHSSQRE